MIQLLIFVLFSGMASGAEFREFSGKARILQMPKTVKADKNSVSPLVKTKLLVTEIIDSDPRDPIIDFVTGKIEAQKKYDVRIQLEKSKSLKKEDQIYFVCSWTCHPTSEVCFEKKWREVSEAEAKARIKTRGK